MSAMVSPAAPADLGARDAAQADISRGSAQVMNAGSNKRDGAGMNA